MCRGVRRSPEDEYHGCCRGKGVGGGVLGMHSNLESLGKYAGIALPTRERGASVNEISKRIPRMAGSCYVSCRPKEQPETDDGVERAELLQSNVNTVSFRVCEPTR